MHYIGDIFFIFNRKNMKEMRQASFYLYLLCRAWFLLWKEIAVLWTTAVVIKPLIRGVFWPTSLWDWEVGL